MSGRNPQKIGDQPRRVTAWFEVPLLEAEERIRVLEAAIRDHRDETHRPGFLSTGSTIEDTNSKLWGVLDA